MPKAETNFTKLQLRRRDHIKPLMQRTTLQ